MSRRAFIAGLLASLLILLLTLAPLLSVSAGENSESSLDDAANQIATFLSDLNASDVMVKDFTGPLPQSSGLGSTLASQFSVVLARKAGFAIARRPEGQQLSRPQSTSGREHATGGVNTSASVEGEFWNGDNVLAIGVRAAVKSIEPEIRTETFSVSYTLPVPEEFKGRIGTALPAYPKEGENGYTKPHCIFCPRADYSDTASKNKTQGAVELLVVVDPEGKMSDFRVAKALPDGLTESAIDAVRRWRLTPATGPDGRPASVISSVEVQFQLF
jgi:TonB family protein